MRTALLLSAALLSVMGASAQKPVEQKTETRVIIRDGSFSGEKPLVLVDGKVVADMNSISPDRISTVDVLKGEGATKLYGSEGKNGVIVITTKGPKLDTVPTGQKQISKTVTINTIRKSDGTKDTTIIRSDSITVKVEDDRIIVNGMPMVGTEGRIVKGFALPDIEGTIWDNKPAPKIGLSVQDTEDGKGTLVTAVVATGAASKAGIQVNDRIVSVDQISINDVDELKRAIERTRDKRSVMIQLFRGKKEINVELVYPREFKRADL